MSAIEDNAFKFRRHENNYARVDKHCMKFANIPVQIYMYEHQVRNTWQFIFVDVKKKEKKNLH